MHLSFNLVMLYFPYRAGIQQPARCQRQRRLFPHFCASLLLENLILSLSQKRRARLAACPSFLSIVLKLFNPSYSTTSNSLAISWFMSYNKHRKGVAVEKRLSPIFFKVKKTPSKVWWLETGFSYFALNATMAIVTRKTNDKNSYSSISVAPSQGLRI